MQDMCNMNVPLSNWTSLVDWLTSNIEGNCTFINNEEIKLTNFSFDIFNIWFFFPLTFSIFSATKQTIYDHFKLFCYMLDLETRIYKNGNSYNNHEFRVLFYFSIFLWWKRQVAADLFFPSQLWFSIFNFWCLLVV